MLIDIKESSFAYVLYINWVTDLGTVMTLSVSVYKDSGKVTLGATGEMNDDGLEKLDILLKYAKYISSQVKK
jgi:predicted secreted protein